MRIQLYVNKRGEKKRENKNEYIKQVILFSILSMDVYPSTQSKCATNWIFLWPGFIPTCVLSEDVFPVFDRIIKMCDPQNQ